VNLLYTNIGKEPSLSDTEQRISEWRQRKHIVELLPPERLVNYLHFEISSALALVDAIICDANINVVSMDWGKPEYTHPLLRALRLANAVRSLPEECAMRDGRKWKNIPFIIFVNPGESDSARDYGQSVAIILSPVCNRNPSLALDRIRQCVDAYYDRLLRDYQNMGMLIRFERGHAQIGPALQKHDSIQESAYYYAPKDCRKNKRWLTVRRDNKGISYDVEILQQLLDQNATETEMQAFFEEHPALLMDLMLGIPVSHKPNFANPRNHTPDFALLPVLGPIEDRTVGLLELKGPTERLLNRRRLHRGLGTRLHQAIDQVRDYDRYLKDPANVDCILKAFGYLPVDSKMAVLIGRNSEKAERETLMQRLGEIDVRVVTYDMVLQTQAIQLEFRS
jgi:hypothetical protein